MNPIPVLSMSGYSTPGHRRHVIDLAQEIEDRGFPGINCTSGGDCIAVCQLVLGATRSITVVAGIQPIYHRIALSLADGERQATRRRWMPSKLRCRQARPNASQRY